MNIILDPGHHADRDNRHRGYSEQKTMLSIAKRCKHYAEKTYGITVGLTRDNERPLSKEYAADLQARAALGRDADLFLSLHSDASSNPSVCGNTVYGNIDPDRADPALYQSLTQAVARATGVSANSIRYREDSDPSRYVVHTEPVAGKTNYYAVLRHCKARVSALIELGFHTHEKERMLLSDPDTQQRIAQALMDAATERLLPSKIKSDPDDFIAQILPEVLVSAGENRLLPGLILAQAILESGHGRSELAVRANNLFGIKASPPWTGETIRYKKEDYRAYPNKGASIRDHGSFFTSTPARIERYRGIPGEKHIEKAVQRLGASGYATDPLYAEKLLRVIRAYDLQRFDKMLLTEKCPCEWSISLLRSIGK